MPIRIGSYNIIKYSNPGYESPPEFWVRSANTSSDLIFLISESETKKLRKVKNNFMQVNKNKLLLLIDATLLNTKKQSDSEPKRKFRFESSFCIA
jgi:hypothetical protein